MHSHHRYPNSDMFRLCRNGQCACTLDCTGHHTDTKECVFLVERMNFSYNLYQFTVYEDSSFLYVKMEGGLGGIASFPG